MLYNRRVIILRSRTDPRWIEAALSDLDRTLGDHVHCEKKAAATAISLIADYPDRPERVRALAKLAQEENQHFLAVLNELQRRGGKLPPDEGDPYAQALVRLVRSGAERLLDRLLVGALIEARSCERLELLGPALPEERLRLLFQRLAQSEKGHERLFQDLAADAFGAGPAQARLAELAEAEALIVAGLPLLPRIH